MICRPDLAALQSRGAIPSSTVIPSAIPPPMAAFTGPNLEDLEAPRRQTSVDAEAIKIVIHDVDSGPICSSKRRIVLRKDPSDKAHRSKFYYYIRLDLLANKISLLKMFFLTFYYRINSSA